MPTIQKILCPVDFSPTSENALRYALLLADYYRAEVVLLNVLFPETEAVAEVPLAVPSINRARLDDTRAELQQFSDRVLTQVIEQLKNAPILLSDLEVGATAPTINQIADREEVDFVVMGTHGKEQTSWLFGSVAQSAIRHLHVPILIVPTDTEFSEPQHITFATDLHRTDPLHVMEIDNLLEPFTTVIRCVHVDTPNHPPCELYMEDLVRVFAGAGLDSNITFHELEEEDVTEALEEFNIVYHTDLQVMVRPRRGFLENLFHRSQTKQTAKVTQVPLLVIPEK